MKLELVISGGQTGADRGGLQAAKRCGIPTGGWMPRGFLAHDGFRPDLAAEFGLQEHSSPKYPPRTRMNVYHSHATIRIARNWASYGELGTLKYIQQFRRPWFDVTYSDGPIDINGIVEFIRLNQVRVLNIAGNAERTAPGIEIFTSEILSRVFQLLDC